MFHQQKHYIFRALEADAFPRFLRAKAFANLSPAGSFWRLIMGLLILWGGFVLGFSLIFLDRQPRALRVWVSTDPRVDTTLSSFYLAVTLYIAFRSSPADLSGPITLPHSLQSPPISLLLPLTPFGPLPAIRDRRIQVNARARKLRQEVVVNEGCMDRIGLSGYNGGFDLYICFCTGEAAVAIGR